MWRNADSATRVALVAGGLSLVIALALTGLFISVANDPQGWFPDAYAEKGERGDPGPEGSRGPRGKPGPVGPSARSAIDDLYFQLESLALNDSGAEALDQLEQLSNDLRRLCRDLEFEFDLLYLSCVRF